MTLSDIQTIAEANHVSLLVESGKMVLDGPNDAVNELIPLVKKWKPELIQMLAGETIGDVGHCDHCNADIIGLPVSFDGFVNRVCGACGRWATCLPPNWSSDDLAEYIDERAAIMEHSGGLPRDEADRKAIEAVRNELEKQKSIFDAADRIVYDSKGGRQSGKTDDRDNQLKRS